MQGTVVDGTITGFNKGGVLVELGDLKGETAQHRHTGTQYRHRHSKGTTGRR